MGTDIHLFAEVQQPDGTWQAVTTAGNPKWDEPPVVAMQFSCDRCYDLFAVLANVRNGHGFAGIVTGLPIEPMAKPKGTPHDASPEIAQALKNGDHSPLLPPPLRDPRLPMDPAHPQNWRCAVESIC